MSGIILLIILGIWFFIVKALARLCVIKMQPGTKKTSTHIILFILIFIAPVLDEIIGGFQFRAMCTPENMLVYEPEKIMGRTIRPKDTPNYSIDNKIIPMRVTHSQWVDSATGEVLIEHKIFYAKGGWLSRSLGAGISLNGSCDSREYYELFEKFNITTEN